MKCPKCGYEIPEQQDDEDEYVSVRIMPTPIGPPPKTPQPQKVKL